jgi:nicotinamidase/pyrazinamidase
MLYCVAWSAEDATRLGYEVIVLEDACRGIGLPTAAGRTTVDDAWARLTASGIRFACAAEIG